MSLPSGYTLDNQPPSGGNGLPAGYTLDQADNSQSQQSQPTGYQTPLQGIASGISNGMSYVDNPGKLFGVNPPVANQMAPQGDQLFNNAGETASEYIRQKGYPNLGAGVGTAISMANPENWITNAKAIPGKIKLPGAGIAEDMAQSAARRTLGYTKGMLKKPGALDRANEVGQIMLDQGVIKNPLTNPLSFGAEDTFGRASDLADTSGQAIGKTISDLSGKPAIDTNAVGMEVSNQLSPKYSGGIYDAQANIANEIMDTIGAHGNGPIDFVSAQALKQKLGEIAQFAKNSDALKANMYQRAYGIVNDAIEKAVGSATEGTPASGQYLQNKAIYGASKEAEKALLNRMSSEAGNRRVGLTDTILAGGELASGHPGAAAALVGLKHGIENAGNALTARIMDYMARSGTVGKTGVRFGIADLIAAKNQERRQ
jgi:hypothetical protein